MIKNNNPWKLGQEHIAPDGTKLIVCQPERDGSGCMVCDGCWYLNNKKQCPCPSCRGPFVWIDASWGVIFRTPEQVKKDEEVAEKERKWWALHGNDRDEQTNYW